MKNYRYLFLLVILFYLSCQTNKRPLWVDNPPEDDSLNYYLVVVSKESSFVEDAIEAIFIKFDLGDNNYLYNLIKEDIEDAYIKNKDGSIDIVDKWTSDDNKIYVLVKLSREIYEPYFKLYTERMDEIENYTSATIVLADSYMESGEYHSAFINYIKAIDELLSYNDEFYTLLIIELLNKIETIFSSFSLMDLTTFDSLNTGEIPGDKNLSFKLPDGYNSFVYNIYFNEGWDKRERKATVLIRDNRILFVPSIPMVTGKYKITGEIDLDIIESKMDIWGNRNNLKPYVKILQNKISKVKEKSRINFTYNASYNIFDKSNLLSFNNEYISEGIIRYFLDNNIENFTAPLVFQDQDFFNYVREIDKLTESQFKYIVIGKNLGSEISEIESGTLVKLTLEIDIVDINSNTIIHNHKFSSEFLVTSDDINTAFLDLGLRIGDYLYSLKF